MANPYDDLLGAEGASLGTYDQLAQEAKDSQRQQLRTNIVGAREYKPGDAAKALKLERATSIPAEAVAANLPQVEADNTLNVYERLLETSPRLAQAMTSDRLFTAVAMEDVQMLSRAENILRPPSQQTPWPSTIMRGLGVGFREGGELLRQGVRRAFADLIGSQEMQRDAERRTAAAQGKIADADPNLGGDVVAEGLYGGLRSLAQATPGIAASLVTGNPMPALAGIGVQTGATEYGKFRNRGASPTEAGLGAVGSAAVEVGTELLPMGYLVRSMGKVNAGQFLTGLLAREMPGEQLATIVQDAIDTAVANPDKTWQDYLNERPEAAVKTALGVLVMSGAMGAVNRVGTRMAQRQQAVEQAQTGAKLLADLSGIKNASQLASHDPTTFAHFIDFAAVDGPVTEVYVNATRLGETLLQSGVKVETLEAAMPGFTQRYTDALQTEGDVRLTVGEFAGHFAGTPLEQALVEDLRTTPDGLSVREANDFLQNQAAEFQAETERTLAAAQVDDAFTTSQAAVEQQVLEQLKGAGRFTDSVNRAYAALMSNFYATMAVRTGVTPEEFAAKYPIKVSAETAPAKRPESDLGLAQPAGAVAPREWATVLPGAQVDGRTVREQVPNLESIGASIPDAEVLPGVRSVPMSAMDQGYIESIRARSLNQRTQKLADDIAASGELNPLIVAIDAEGPYILEGAHRYDALIKAGATEFPAVVVLDGDNSLNQSPVSDIGHKREATSGRYVGAPERIGNSPQKLAALRKEIMQLAREGEAGRYWYENSSRALLEFVGGDRVEAEKLAALIAIYSPNATVPANTSMALTAYYQFRAGVPIKAGFGVSNAKAQALLSGGERWGGIKTNSFYQNLMVHIDPTKLEPGVATMDMWMAIAFDYGMKTVDQGPKYKFMERETQRVARELGWSPHQVQAAIWTAMKGRIDPIRPQLRERELKLGIRAEFEKDGKTLDAVVKGKESDHFYLARKMGMAQEYDRDAIETAKYDFSDAIAERAVQISWEATPGASTNVLPGIHSASVAQKMEYLRAITEVLNPGGKDLIAEAVGLPPGRNLFGWSAWDGVVGAGAQTLVATPLEGAGGKRTFKPEAAEALKAYATMRGYALAQEAVVWHLPVFDSSKKASNGVELSSTRALTVEETQELYSALNAKFGTWEIAPAYTHTGARMLNFVDGLSNEDFQKGVQEIIGALPDTFGGGSLTAKAYRSEGGAVSNDWRQNPNGEGYLESGFGGRPDLQERARALRARVETVNRRFADRYGWDQPGDGSPVGLGDVELAEAQRAATEAAFGAERLIGLPDAPMQIGGQWYVPGPFAPAHDAAREYMRRAGLEYVPPRTYVKVDKARAARIAAEYDRMQHAPHDPEVKAAYEALAKETIAQYRAVLETGLQVEFIDFAKQGDPYAASPRLAIQDVITNNHMWVFSTRDGFGSDAAFDPAANPLLAETEFTISGKPALVNDLFRVVHDYFGHIKDGVGFRADGEENTWRSHAAMFSPLARRALTTETRGQNSWVNFGPHGETNRTASASDTVFADQKTGLLPQWVVDEGRTDGELFQAPEPLPVEQLEQAQPTAKGAIAFGAGIGVDPATIKLFDAADLSTFLHEAGHFFLEVLTDVASQPNAPQAVLDDVATFLKWANVPDLQTWKGWTVGQKREAHEQWARTFESYLFTGQAPSRDLNSLFGRFRAWLLNVYRAISALRAKPTKEIAAVFDRMLASEQAIKEAEIERSLGAVFTSAEEAQMTATEWAAYQALGEEASGEAVKTLQTQALRNMQWLAGARAGKLRQMQRRVATLRKGVEAEVRAEVRTDKVYAAAHFLRTGEMTTGDPTNAQRKALDAVAGFKPKLDRTALKEMYGDGPAALWRYVPNNMTATEDGVHPDLVAKVFGFSSGDHLVRSMMEAESESSVVEGKTDQRMLERHGDLTVPGSLERAVDAALASEARARMLTVELNALSRATGKPKVMAQAAKAFADQVVARRRLKELSPAKFERAAQRNARAADAFLKKGQIEEAATEKRNQLVNTYGAKAARDAEDAVEADLRYLRRFDNAKVRKSVDPDYVDQIDAILERYTLRPVSEREGRKRASLLKWVEQQQAMGLDPAIAEGLLDEARQQPYTSLTVEEWRGVVDSIKSIEHLGRLKSKLLTAEDQRAFNARVEEAEAAIRGNAKRPAKVQLERNQWRDRIARFKDEVFAIHRKFASLMREMDGWADNGVMWKLLVRPMNKAADNEAAARGAAADKLAELFKPLMRTGSMRQKMFIPEIGTSLSREGRLAVALNWGNADNRDRVLEGDKWTPAQAEAILATLTREEWGFVQGTWDYLNTFWPSIAAKERRVSGVEPERVEATPFTRRLRDGSVVELSGGYYPIKADPDRSGKAEALSAAELVKQAMQGKLARATTRRGHTKARGESGLGPVHKSLSVLFGHVDQVIHDLSWHEWLIDANRLLRPGGRLDTAIREHYSPAVSKALHKMLEDVAVGEIGAQNVFEASINHVRTGATIAGLGWNISTAMLQPLGLTQSMVRIGPKWVAKGMWQWMRDAASMENSVRIIREKSVFMANRGKTMQREINEIRNRVEKGRITPITDSFFWMIQKMQQVADTPTWLGQYEKSMADGVDEATAIALADQAVLDAQGGGQIKDLAQIQRGSPLLKLWTNFYSFFNTTYNLLAEARGRTTFSKPAHIGRLAVDVLLLLTVPAILSALLKDALKGDLDDDPEELFEKLAREQLNYALGTMVGIRDVAAFVNAKGGYTGPAGTRFFAEVFKFGQQVEQGDFDAALLKAANSTAGVLFHYPSGQVQRTAQGINALLEGETSNPLAPLVGVPPKNR